MTAHARRRRLCMVVHAYYPLMETRVQREAELLLDRGWQVDVVCLRLPDEAEREVVNGVTVHRLPAGRRTAPSLAAQLAEYLAFFARAAVALTRLHARRDYDVVQVHNLPDFLVFAAFIPRLAGARIVLDIHDLMPEFMAARTGRSPRSPLVRAVALQERASAAFAHHVITVTATWRRVLAERGTPLRKTSVVMNLADPRHFRPCPPRPADPGRFRLVYHGTLTPRYGLDVAIGAVAGLRAEIPEIELLIHGQGPDRDRLAALVADLGVGDAVRIQETVLPVGELATMLCDADVGLVPYRRDVFTDGILPTKLLEYMAIGLPTIASRTPAIDAHADPAAVELFTPDDVDDLSRAIRRLHDPAVRAALKAGTARMRERFDWTRQADAYAATVEELAAR